MNVLGINHFYHDSTACIVTDGRIAVAIEEERLTRDKHTTKFPRNAIARCLAEVGLGPGDIDAIAVSIKPFKDWPAKVGYGLARPRMLKGFAANEIGGGMLKQFHLRNWYRETWPGGGPTIHFVPHHTAHAVGTFLVSPYESAAILSLDGAGEWATSFLGEGRGTKVTRLAESFFPNSMGVFYEAPTEFCGFKANYDEGKTMGLAPFGDHSVHHDEVARMVTVQRDGTIKLDTSYFGFHGAKRCGPKFTDAFGTPRKGGTFEEHHMNVAAAFQSALEEKALELCAVLREKTTSRHLIIAGGVALNSVMNGRIVQEADFDDIYVMPAAGDNGTAIGAAMYVYNVVLQQPRVAVHDDPYLGTAYSDEYIADLIRSSKLRAERHDDIAAVVARMLADGRIVGWFQGRMEIGPRALGNRSILANPTLHDMKDRVNAEVKHREAFRPFAPSVRAEAADTYFDVTGESPFMLKVCPVRPEMRDRLPAITHVDGTARLHTVRRETNPLYYDLIGKFGELTGTPVVLNTSFNVMGEPIVESPEQAMRCFFTTGLDALAMGSYLITKESVS